MMEQSYATKQPPPAVSRSLWRGGTFFQHMLLYSCCLETYASGLSMPTTISSSSAYTPCNMNPLGRLSSFSLCTGSYSLSFSATTTTTLFGKRMKNKKYQIPDRLVPQTEYISLLSSTTTEGGSSSPSLDDDSDYTDNLWKLIDIVNIVEKGGLGVLPFNVGYGFITPLNSKDGVQRLVSLLESSQQHLLQENNNDDSPPPELPKFHLLCNKLNEIDEYCYGIDKNNFKLLKTSLPSSDEFFLLPMKTTIPQKNTLFESKYTYKPSTIPVGISNDPIVMYLQNDLFYEPIPLLYVPLPLWITNSDDYYYYYSDEDDNDNAAVPPQMIQCNPMDSLDRSSSWCEQVDFIIDAGSRPHDAATIYDLSIRSTSSSSSSPNVYREGMNAVLVEATTTAAALTV